MILKSTSKRKNRGAEFIKIENYCVSKDTIKEMKRKDCEKTFSNHIPDKGLDLDCVKNLYNSIIK